MKKVQLTDNLLYVTNKGFNFELSDDKGMRQFGILFEINDTRDYDEKASEDYPYIVSAGIIADSPNESFNESDEKPSKESLLLDCNGYMGTIPIDHILTDSIKGSNEGKGEAFEALASQFTINEACIETIKHSHGTIAAQRGLVDFKYLKFRNEETCVKFIDYIIKHRLSAMGMMIGFVLDRPINMIGDSGWSQIETMVNGK